MAYKTRRELVLKALSLLFVTPAGQTPADDDFSACDGYVDGLVAELEQRGVILISDPENIPVAYFHPLAVCLADAARTEFGAPEVNVGQAENKLRIMARSGPTGETLRTTYF